MPTAGDWAAMKLMSLVLMIALAVTVVGLPLGWL